MPYVPVPKDLSKVKTKVALNLTKRQLICFGSAAAVGFPVYIVSRLAIGNQNALILMIIVMLPLFFMAIYEKDGQPAEKVIGNYLRAKFIYPEKRLYKTENFYEYLEKEAKTVVRKKSKK